MNEETLQSLRAIVEYLETDELRDWISLDYPYQHIFNDLRRVKIWLNQSDANNSLSEARA